MSVSGAPVAGSFSQVALDSTERAMTRLSKLAVGANALIPHPDFSERRGWAEPIARPAMEGGRWLVNGLSEELKQ